MPAPLHCIRSGPASLNGVRRCGAMRVRGETTNLVLELHHVVGCRSSVSGLFTEMSQQHPETVAEARRRGLLGSISKLQVASEERKNHRMHHPLRRPGRFLFCVSPRRRLHITLSLYLSSSRPHYLIAAAPLSQVLKLALVRSHLSKSLPARDRWRLTLVRPPLRLPRSTRSRNRLALNILPLKHR